jgi:lysophospholipase L1-like esterase
VIFPEDIRPPDPRVNPHDPLYDWRILAEGDSWFSIGTIPSSNLIFELRFPKWTLILNLAYPGETLIRIAELANNQDLVDVLARKRFNYPWDAILLSGGGNDLIARAEHLVRKVPIGPADEPESHIDADELEDLVQDVQAGYRRIVELRDAPDSLSKGKPIVAHTYDYPTPRNAPARFVVLPIAGPWLYRVFEARRIGEALRVAISDLLLDRMAHAIRELASDSGSAKALPGFHVVDTRKTLVRAEPDASGNSRDWRDEIHPNMEGYRKLARKIEDRFITLLP